MKAPHPGKSAIRATVKSLNVSSFTVNVLPLNYSVMVAIVLIVTTLKTMNPFATKLPRTRRPRINMPLILTLDVNARNLPALKSTANALRRDLSSQPNANALSASISLDHRRLLIVDVRLRIIRELIRSCGLQTSFGREIILMPHQELAQVG